MRKLLKYGKLKGTKQDKPKELVLLDGCNYVSWKDGVKR